MQDEYNINKEVIEDLSRKLNELERQDWQKRLSNEPLTPTEETEKLKQGIGKRWLDNIVDPEEIEKDYIREEKKRLQKKLGGLINNYHRTRREDKGGMKDLARRFQEHESNGVFYRDLEDSYEKLKKEIKRNSSKYG